MADAPDARALAALYAEVADTVGTAARARGLRRVFAFDTEFDAADWSRLACVSGTYLDLEMGAVDGPHLWVRQDPAGGLAMADAMYDPGTLIVGLNTAIDMRVTATAYGLEAAAAEAYRCRRVGDVMLRELLEALARPGKARWVSTLGDDEDDGSERQAGRGYLVWSKARWSEGAGGWDPYTGGAKSVAKGLSKRKARATMEAIAWRRCGVDLEADKGPDSWRLRYGELVDLPPEEWPEEAAAYARGDSAWTLGLWLQQCRRPSRAPYDYPRLRWWDRLTEGTGGLAFAHEADRAEYAWVLECIARGPGIPVDQAWAGALCGRYRVVEDVARAYLEERGIIYHDRKGPHVRKSAIAAEVRALYEARPDVPPDLTETGRKKFPQLEGAPLESWPEEARAYISGSGKSVRYVLGPRGDDAAAIVEDPVAALGWEPARLRAALEASASASVLAHNVQVKAHTLGGVAAGLAAFNRANPDYLPLMDTGRISAKGGERRVPQNLPRTGGIRECLWPGEGWAFVIADYTAMEMAAWSYLRDRIAERAAGVPDGSMAGPLTLAINGGQDPHLLLGLRLLRNPEGWSYATAKALRGEVEKALEAVEGDKAAAKAARPDLPWTFALALLDARQRAKAGNFGFAGGMGPRGFIRAQAKQGLLFTLAEARELQASWKAMWETDPYFGFIGGMDARGQKAGTGISMRVPGSGLHLGGRRYTQAANVLFQGLCAKILKEAATSVWRATAGLEGDGPLVGAHLVHLVHDEIVMRVPQDRAKDALADLRARMVAPASWLMPGVTLRASGAILTERLRKV